MTNYFELLQKNVRLISTVTDCATCCPVHSSCLWGKCPAMPGWGWRNSTLTELLPMFCQMPAIIYLPSKGWAETQPVIFHQPLYCLCLVCEISHRWELEKDQLHGRYFAYKQSKRHKVSVAHRHTLTLTHARTHHRQAWKPSSQLSASNDPFLAARVRSASEYVANQLQSHCSHICFLYYVLGTFCSTFSLDPLQFIVYLSSHPLCPFAGLWAGTLLRSVEKILTVKVTRLNKKIRLCSWTKIPLRIVQQQNHQDSSWAFFFLFSLEQLRAVGFENISQVLSRNNEKKFTGVLLSSKKTFWHQLTSGRVGREAYEVAGWAECATTTWHNVASSSDVTCTFNSPPAEHQTWQSARLQGWKRGWRKGK